MGDGDIDYCSYTLRELEEALDGINAQKYPQNYVNLCRAYERLAPGQSEAASPDFVDAERPPDDDPGQGLWGGFWTSRPIAGLGDAGGFWWSYDLHTYLDDCLSGYRLLGVFVDSICGSFGPEVASVIPFLLGLFLLAYAVLPRRQAGA